MDKIVQGLALVDYDNMCKPTTLTQAEVELQTETFVDSLVDEFQIVFPEVSEIDVRFYGGWIDEKGLLSPMANLMYKLLPILRGRRNGLIVRPTVAMTMLGFPKTILIGTVRLLPKKSRQKMVDGMLGCDATLLASKGFTRIGIITDDEDIIPAVLTANATAKENVVWMRHRTPGSGLNDQVLHDCGVNLHSIGR